MFKQLIRSARRPAPAVQLARRYLSKEPKEVLTRLNDPNDPARNLFFQYTWGSWLKNDRIEKARRETRFSIEALSTFVKSLNVNEPALVKPKHLDNGIKVLPHNWSEAVIGPDNFDVKSISSIHEGKHHRIYKVTLQNNKVLVLRIPYKLESDFAIENKINSEAATLDFLSVKLEAHVPRVVAFAPNHSNPLQTPFILMEHIEGQSLMKEWDPLAEDSEDNTKKLKLVIDTMMDFQAKLLQVTFNRSGSLYFYDDVKPEHQSVAPYEETNSDLANRWRVGPSVERHFSRGKKHLSATQIQKFTGPWECSQPLQVMADAANIQLESLRCRLAAGQAGTQIEDLEALRLQIKVYEDFKTISTQLLNPDSESIKNGTEMFKPRLHVPDLDPLNVIVADGKPYFVDFEHTTIKPFILTGYPSFVAYYGTKFYNLEDEVEGYKDLDDITQQQYKFSYFKTRNERLWELALNSRRHDLIATASPLIKMLRYPYLQVLDCKRDADFITVENALMQLPGVWDMYSQNGLVTGEFPIQYTAEEMEAHLKDLQIYDDEIAHQPFAACGGWVPQDMFALLKSQGFLVADENGDHRIEKEEVLRDVEQTEAEDEAPNPKTE